MNKPTVTASTLERMFAKQAAVDCPESRLLIAVIVMSLADATSPDIALAEFTGKNFVRKKAGVLNKLDAIRWLDSNTVENMANLVGIDPEFVREIPAKINVLGGSPPNDL